MELQPRRTDVRGKTVWIRKEIKRFFGMMQPIGAGQDRAAGGAHRAAIKRSSQGTPHPLILRISYRVIPALSWSRRPFFTYYAIRHTPYASPSDRRFCKRVNDFVEP